MYLGWGHKVKRPAGRYWQAVCVLFEVEVMAVAERGRTDLFHLGPRPDRGLFARNALTLVLWIDENSCLWGSDKMSSATNAGPIRRDTHIRRRLPDEAVRAKRLRR
jgi:hypothetical protein